MDRGRRQREDVPKPIGVAAANFDRWLEDLGRLEPPLHIWTYFLFSKLGFTAVGDALSAFRRVTVEGDGGLPIFTLHPRGGRASQVPPLDGWFVLIPIREVRRAFKLVSISGRDFWQRELIPFIGRRYPDIAPIYFTQRELEQSLVQFQDALPPSQRLRIVRHSTKERMRVRGSKPKHRGYRSAITYTAEPITTVFQLAHERRQWFKSLTLDVERIHEDEVVDVVVTVSVSKDGWIAWDSAEDDHRQLEAALIAGSSDRLDLYENRGLVSGGERAGKPIVIQFDSDVFDDIKVLRTMSATMMRYPASAKAVLHQNPYFHMSICDEADGSALDMWILNPRRVMFVPRRHASVAALNRLVNYVTENVREGSVQEYQISD